MKKKSYFGILTDLYITEGQEINFLEERPMLWQQQLSFNKKIQ